MTTGADRFMADFTEANRQFTIASAKHLKTPWWRFFKAAKHLREMRAATNEVQALNERLQRGEYSHDDPA